MLLVYAISPNLDTFDGDPCYPNLAALPFTPDGVVLAARPEVTLDVVPRLDCPDQLVRCKPSARQETSRFPCATLGARSDEIYDYDK